MRKDGKRIDVESTVSPIIGPEGDMIGSASIARDITERKRAHALVESQARLLEFVAGGAELPLVLDRIARFVEEYGDDVVASILLLHRDGRHLSHGAAPSLPASYCEAIDGAEIGPRAGSCGTAAYRRERVSVTDIATDPLWDDYRAAALGAGLRACWSTPIFATDDALLGTFALYYREPRESSDADLELVELATHVAGIAIERARAEEAARESDRRYRDLFENANEPIATVTMDERITEVNRAFEHVLGYTREELIGTNLADYVTADALATSRRATERKVSGELSGTTFEQEFIAKDGHSVVLEVSSRVIEEDGRPVGVQGICRDITARKQAELELRRLSELNRHQALHDDLTGLPNRACFGEQVGHAIGVADQDGSQLAVLLMDLDRFKEINDTLGHRYGDLLLIELARRLESVLRHSDTVARLGGDEFGILVRQLSDSEQRSRARARAHPRGAGAAVRGRRPAAPRRGQHRRRALPGARARRRSAAAARRRRDVRREGDGRAPRHLRREPRPPRHREPHAALGAAARDSRPRAASCTTSPSSTSTAADWPASRR